MRPLELAALGAALAYVAFLFLERALLTRARKSLRLVAHVNGTRGKSETTRLLAAALRASGFTVLAKTTGTEPRTILPDGRERRLFRAGAANVREQRDLVLEAARRGADAVVAECMAVSPEAQRASSAFLSPDILVVTNSRRDHRGELGSPEEAAAVFAEGIPKGGSVVTADPSLYPLLSEAAASLGARAILAEPMGEAGSIFPDNAGAALAAALLAGAERESALAGMRAHLPDPGAFALRRLARKGGGSILVADALAANDPDSTAILWERSLKVLARIRPPKPGARRILLLANRADRPDRSLAFAEFTAQKAADFDALFLLGPLPMRAARRLRAARTGAARTGAGLPDRGASPSSVPRLVRFWRGSSVLAALRMEPEDTFVLAAGNWKGFGPLLSMAAPPLEDAT